LREIKLEIIINNIKIKYANKNIFYYANSYITKIKYLKNVYAQDKTEKKIKQTKKVKRLFGA